MSYYINAVAAADRLRTDIKELIPDAGMRRRMSKMVRMGVCAGMECLKDFGNSDEIDAIITATGLGCLEDSEKFLKNMVENAEQLLTPTPFIQSTFNTVGAQIGLLCKNHAYNMTYAHRGRSFESALLDAMLLLDEDDFRNVLVGAIDYTIPAQIKIMERMGFWREYQPGQGAFFFVLSNYPGEHCLGQVSIPEFLNEEPDPETLPDVASGKALYLSNDERTTGVSPTASAHRFRDALEQLSDAGTIYLCTNYRRESPSLIRLRCI